MSIVHTLIAITGLVSLAALAPASAAEKQHAPSERRVIILDRSLYGPPPPPHERRYVGPAPAVAPPMESVPKVPPLAQPPIR